MKRQLILTTIFLSLCLFVFSARQEKNETLKAMIYFTVQAENGYCKHRVNNDGTITCIIKPSDVIRISAIFFNGSDVTLELNGNKYITPILTKNSTLEICFDNTLIFNPIKYNTIQ